MTIHCARWCGAYAERVACISIRRTMMVNQFSRGHVALSPLCLAMLPLIERFSGESR